MFKIVTIFFCVILTLLSGQVVSQSDVSQNPVLIRYGGIELTRRQFELEFELNMVIRAVRNREPVKNQQEIMTMQDQFLDQSAREMVLLKMASDKGISVSDEEVKTGLDTLMNELGFTAFNNKTVSKLGIRDDSIIKAYMKKNLVLSKLVAQLEHEIQGDNIQRGLQQFLFKIFDQSGIEIFQEQLRSPLSRRYDE
jgi:hypothetical protein